jgi:hypothetical protein
MKFYCLLCLFSLAFISCSTDKEVEITREDQLHKVWKLKAFSFDTQDSVDKQKQLNLEYKLLSLGNYIFLFPDSVFSLVSGNKYAYGKWSFNDPENTIKLNAHPSAELILTEELRLGVYKSQNNEPAYQIKKAISKNGKIELQLLWPGIGIFTYEEHAEMLSDHTSDPFYPTHNSWRNKPTQLESDSALKKRLHDYVEHMKLNFKAAVQRDGKMMSNKHSKGIIAIYEGGIGILEKEDVPYQWLYTYYDDRQAWQAYNMLDKALGHNTISKQYEGNWRKANYEILKEIEKKIIDDL